MLDEKILAMIRDFNLWWENKEIVVPLYKRHIFENIKRYMKTKQIIALVGLRRVGKTVIMKQIIKEHIEENKKENVFYFLFDELISQNTDVLEEILEYYLKTIAKDGRKYIFLDEIQKIPFWQDILKRFYDTQEDLKFIVSGSASLKIKKSKESLAGRIFDFHIPVLTFKEFLELNGNELEIKKAGFEHAKLKENYEKNIHKKQIIETMFLKYILKGAFPEIAKEEDEEIIKSYIKSSVIEKIIFEDIPSVFAIKRKDLLALLFEYCSKETSNLLDITNLSNILSANYHTIKTYLFYLKNSFVIDIIYNYSKSIKKQFRKNKKVHIAHPAITITMMRYKKDILEIEEVVSKYVETIVFQHSKLFAERIFFWRTPQKEEVDIILDNKEITAIEVKYKNKIEKEDYKNLIKFLKKNNLKKGIVITKNLFEKKEINGKEILFIPVWLFLLSVN